MYENALDNALDIDARIRLNYALSGLGSTDPGFMLRNMAEQVKRAIKSSDAVVVATQGVDASLTGKPFYLSFPFVSSWNEAVTRLSRSTLRLRGTMTRAVALHRLNEGIKAFGPARGGDSGKAWWVWLLAGAAVFV